ncbi:MAG: hypothetical protein K2X37_07185 [Chitinophagaceae bacterium]|nr:hypothetical protein [Chitinophagaceae bacterium]
MKKFFLVFLSLISLTSLSAQVKDPVSWTAEAVKKTADTYEIVVTTSIAKPWHIYAQNTPAGGPVATSVSFSPNPLVKLEGKTKETGKMEKINDKIFGVQVFYYSDKVVYTQLAKVKAGIKTNLSVTVKFMVCDDSQCLPPTKKVFDVKLQ